MTTYYADFGNPFLGRTCDLTANGSSAHPYNTLAQVAAAFAAGDDVLFRRSSVLRYGTGVAGTGTIIPNGSSAMWEFTQRTAGVVTLSYYGDESMPPQFDSLIYDEPGAIIGWAYIGDNKWSKQISVNGSNLSTATYPAFTFANVQCGDDKTDAYQLRMRTTVAACVAADDVYITSGGIVTINTGSPTVSPGDYYNGLAWASATGVGSGCMFMYGGSNQLYDGLEFVGGYVQVAGSNVLQDHDVVFSNCSHRLTSSEGFGLYTYRTSVTFSPAPSAGDTVGTLSTAFGETTGAYWLFFSAASGANDEQRLVTLTKGSAAVPNWGTPLGTGTYQASVGIHRQDNYATGFKILDCTLYSGQRSLACFETDTGSAFGQHNGITVTGNHVGAEIRNPVVYDGYRHSAISAAPSKRYSSEGTFPSNLSIYGTQRCLIECVPYEYGRAFGLTLEGGFTVRNFEVTGQANSSQCVGVGTFDNLYFHDLTRQSSATIPQSTNHGGDDNTLEVSDYVASTTFFAITNLDLTIKNCVIDGPTNYAIRSGGNTNTGPSLPGSTKVYNNLIIEDGVYRKLYPVQGAYSVGIGVPWLSEGPQTSVIQWDGWAGAEGSRLDIFKNNVFIRPDDNVFAVKSAAGLLVYDLYSANDTGTGAAVPPTNNLRYAALSSVLESNFHPTITSPAVSAGANVGVTTDAAGHTFWAPPSIGPYEAFRARDLRVRS